MTSMPLLRGGTQLEIVHIEYHRQTKVTTKMTIQAQLKISKTQAAVLRPHSRPTLQVR